MKLIVGLGNPGPEYHRTRHNVGFDVLTRLARRHAPGASVRSRFHGAAIDTTIDTTRATLLKPTTYMNRSGLAVAEAVRFFKINISDDLLVVVDDISLECGNLRLRAEGSAGGHNGLQDIEEKLGTASYPRLRIGIDPPGDIPQRDYVLGRFRPDQLELMEPALERATEAVECWAVHGLDRAMNTYNRKNPV